MALPCRSSAAPARAGAADDGCQRLKPALLSFYVDVIYTCMHVVHRRDADGPCCRPQQHALHDIDCRHPLRSHDVLQLVRLQQCLVSRQLNFQTFAA